MSEIEYRADERLTRDEYVAFLHTSDLGSMYPRKEFDARVERLLANTDVTVTARRDGTLVGVALGITDHVYFMFLTDLGVAREFQRRGIGRTLVTRAHAAAGGPADITLVTWANRAALPVYASLGIVPQSGLVAVEATDWELFDVRAL